MEPLKLKNRHRMDFEVAQSLDQAFGGGIDLQTALDDFFGAPIPSNHGTHVRGISDNLPLRGRQKPLTGLSFFFFGGRREGRGSKPVLGKSSNERFITVTCKVCGTVRRPRHNPHTCSRRQDTTITNRQLGCATRMMLEQVSRLPDENYEQSMMFQFFLDCVAAQASHPLRSSRSERDPCILTITKL